MKDTGKTGNSAAAAAAQPADAGSAQRTAAGGEASANGHRPPGPDSAGRRDGEDGHNPFDTGTSTGKPRRPSDTTEDSGAAKDSGTAKDSESAPGDPTDHDAGERPVTWVMPAVMAYEGSVSPAQPIRGNVEPAVWRAIHEFADDYDPDRQIINLDTQTTFLELPGVPAELFGQHFGYVPTRSQAYEFGMRDDMIDLELLDADEFGQRLQSAKAERDRRRNAPVANVPPRYAVEKLCVAPRPAGPLTPQGAQRLGALPGWPAVADLTAAGVADPEAVVPTSAQLTAWCEENEVKPAPPLRVVTPTDVRVAVSGHNPATKFAVSDIAAAADGDDAAGWARAASAKAQIDNLANRWDKSSSFSYATLIDFGAAPHDLAALTPLTQESWLASLQLLNDWTHAENKRARDALDTADHDPVSGRWCSLDDLDNLPAPCWLIDKLLPADALVHLVGMPESLKSFTALDMALSIATGTPFAGSARFAVTAAGHVMYVAGEGVGGINKRIKAWCKARAGGDAAREAALRTMITCNLTVLKGAAQLGSRRDMAEVTKKMIETAAVLAIFDTQARCTDELEENSATDQGRAIKAINALKLRTGATVLVVHHSTKADPRNARGSSAWKGAIDVELILVRDSRALTGNLEVTKMKDDEGGAVYPLSAELVRMPGGDTSLVIAPGADPMAANVDLPIEQWTGSGSAYARRMYELAQCNCIPGVGLTQHRLAEIANEVIGTETAARGRERPVRRVCHKNTATGAVKLLTAGGKLIEARRDNLGHVYWQPDDYPPLDPETLAALASFDTHDDDANPQVDTAD